MYTPTPNRLARQANLEDNSSSSSGNGSDSSTTENNGSRSDEVAVYCRLRPLPFEESEVHLLFSQYTGKNESDWNLSTV